MEREKLHFWNTEACSLCVLGLEQCSWLHGHWIFFCMCNINLLPLPPCWERERESERGEEREKHKHDSMLHLKDLTFWHGVLQHKSSDQHKFYQSLFSYQSLSDLYIYMLTWLIYIQEQMSNLVTFVTNHCPNTLSSLPKQQLSL